MLTDPSLSDLHSLSPAHSPLLSHLHALSIHFFSVWTETLPIHSIPAASHTRQPLIGFHAIPSLRPLHLHVISSDLSSPFMKRKQHYLSYTSPFFRPIEAIQGQLQRERIPTLSEDDVAYYEELCKGTLLSHITGEDFGNKMAKLRRHLESASFTSAYNPPTWHLASESDR